MAEIVEEVRNLVLLDRLDHEWWTCKQELEATPRAIVSEQATADALRATAEATRQQLAATRKAVASGEADLASTEKRRNRAIKRMPTMMTSTQIEATQREITTLSGEAEALEEAILEGMELTEELEARLAAEDQAVADADAALVTRRAVWLERSSALDARCLTLEVERDPVEKGLRADAGRGYKVGWRLGRFNPPSGITGVKGYVCGTCHNRVSPLWVQESQKWAGLHACDTCKRVIVFDPDAPPPVAAPAPPAEAAP